MCVHCYKLLLHKPTIALLWSGLYHIHQLGKEIERLLNACPTVLDEKNTNILSVITFSDISSTGTKTLRDPVHVEILRDIVILLTPDLS